MIAGVDGCEDGWLAAIEGRDGSILITVFPEFNNLLANVDLQTVVIDIPIGLTSKGPRLCDVEARKFIGVRGSSVFPAPLRSMLKAIDYVEACAIRSRQDGKKCSKQLWAITPKIRQVDRCMTPELQGRVYEGHPEVSFTRMNGGCLTHSKHKPEGREFRIRLLEKYFPDLRSRLAGFSSFRADEDIIDALACLWTARQIQKGTATHFPHLEVLDDHGLRMEIVA